MFELNNFNDKYRHFKKYCKHEPCQSWTEIIKKHKHVIILKENVCMSRALSQKEKNKPGTYLLYDIYFYI